MATVVATACCEGTRRCSFWDLPTWTFARVIDQRSSHLVRRRDEYVGPQGIERARLAPSRHFHLLCYFPLLTATTPYPGQQTVAPAVARAIWCNGRVYCRRQRLSIGLLDLLPFVMFADRLRPQPIIQAGVCCSTSVKIFCRRQWLSTDNLQTLLRSTMAIDKYISLSIVACIVYRQVHNLIYCDRQCLSIDTFHVPL